MTRFCDEVPGWPPLAGVAALLLAAAVGALAPLPAGLAGGIAGAEESTPAAALPAALLFAAGVILVVTRLGALTRRSRPGSSVCGLPPTGCGRRR